MQYSSVLLRQNLGKCGCICNSWLQELHMQPHAVKKYFVKLLLQMSIFL